MGARRVLAVIPARAGSQRLPRKPLVSILGKPLVQWVHEAAAQVEEITELVVATDDEEIRDVVRAFGGSAVMTRGDHPSGTDRVAEVAASRPWADVVVNVQGDEPLLPPDYLRAGLAPFLAGEPVRMATLAAPIADPADLSDPGVAKVVLDRAGDALYFSRAAIPFRRGADARYLRQVGIYFFAREALFEFVALPPSALEIAEGLEQLRALENRIPIRVVGVAAATPHVDTAEDVTKVEALLQGR
jgi:3-deoxy-manno-octulosonate cytidylyltransferase (CMP-KDO synthetase)